MDLTIFSKIFQCVLYGGRNFDSRVSEPNLGLYLKKSKRNPLVLRHFRGGLSVPRSLFGQNTEIPRGKLFVRKSVFPTYFIAWGNFLASPRAEPRPLFEKVQEEPPGFTSFQGGVVSSKVAIRTKYRNTPGQTFCTKIGFPHLFHCVGKFSRESQSRT